jgi:hypothetical protein
MDKSLESVIRPETIRSYRDTEYRVDAHPPFAIHVDEYCAALAALYLSNQVNSCAFITAYNPHSQLLMDATNTERHAELIRELQRRNLKFFHGEGKHPTGDWPAEKSLLVMGLPREAAMSIGRQYEQNAIIWCGPDAVPQLVLLR